MFLVQCRGARFVLRLVWTVLFVRVCPQTASATFHHGCHGVDSASVDVACSSVAKKKRCLVVVATTFFFPVTNRTPSPTTTLRRDTTFFGIKKIILFLIPVCSRLKTKFKKKQTTPQRSKPQRHSPLNPHQFQKMCVEPAHF